MSDTGKCEMVTRWEPEDVERWCAKIRADELDFAEQVRIVQFISDQQKHYLHLHDNYKKLWDAYETVRGRVATLAGPVSEIVNLASNGDMYDETTLRAALKYWTDQIVDDLF